MKSLSNSLYSTLMYLVIPLSLIHAKKDFTPAFVQHDPFAVNTVSPVRLTYGEEGQSRIAERISSLPLSGTPEEMARQFLEENISLFQMQPGLSDVIVEEIQQSPGGNHVRFHQIFESIKVFRSQIVVSIDNENKESFYMSDYRPNIDLTTVVPLISEQEAIEASTAALGASGVYYADPAATLMILPLISGYSLGYRVVVPCSEPRGDWEIFLDALDGSIVWIHDMSQYYDGSGKVFDPDPLATSEHYYGTDGYTDNNDADATVLNNERITVTLTDIDYNFEESLYYLSGPYVDIVDWDTPNIAPVTSTNGYFYYTRSQSGFEDVMVYYHIDKLQRYLQSIGFTDIHNYPVTADPHGMDGADNSQYFYSTDRLTFGEGIVDDAEDADVIWHEYGHALQHAQITGSFSGEMPAISEGFVIIGPVHIQLQYHPGSQILYLPGMQALQLQDMVSYGPEED